MAPDIRKPTREDYLEALHGQNPWIKLGKVPAALAKTRRRILAAELWRTMLQDPFRYQVVMGPRRVGKTVAMYQTIEQLLANGVAPNRLWFLRLDHPLLMNYELGGWARSLMNHFGGTTAAPLYLFLDEVNYSRNWDKWLKTFYDEKWPVRVIATSSSTAALRDRTIESGVGRWSEQFLTPYLFSEYLTLGDFEYPAIEARDNLFDTLVHVTETKPDMGNGAKNFADRLTYFLLLGGFPELLTAFQEENESFENALFRSQQVLRSEAVQRVTGMDIPQAFDIKSPFELERMLYVLGGQIGGIMNVSNLGDTVGVSRSTAHQYVNYLERAFLIFTLPNYSTSEESVQRKGRKVFFVDGAVRNAALQRGLSPLDDSTEQGHLRENAAASHLHALSLQTGSRLYHWRDGKDEVDLVYEDVRDPIAIEVSSKDHALRGLKALQQRYPVFKGRSFMVSAESPLFETPSTENQGIGRMPLAWFLLALGAQTKQALCKRLGLA